MNIQVDIVGGGLSGLASASSLKEHDPSCKVVVYEKYQTLGYNHEGRRCGEAYTLEGKWKRWKPDETSVFNKITAVETTIGDQLHTVERQPGTSYILNRQEFICQLARDAEKLGVKIQTDAKIARVNDLNGDYIIDASGCPSVLKRSLGIQQGSTGSTYQQTIADSNWFVPDTVKMFFTGAIGYYWIFPRDPKKREVNLGIGTLGVSSHKLKEQLEQFKTDHTIKGDVTYVTGGLIPAGLQKPLMHKHILFVGDAGVGTFPLSGQGIYRALLSGETAGHCIAAGRPELYPKLMYQDFLKWDILGKNVLKLNRILMKIGTYAQLSFSNRFFNYWYAFQ